MLLREIGFAYVVLLACLFVGSKALQLLGLDQESISVATGTCQRCATRAGSILGAASLYQFVEFLWTAVIEIAGKK